MNKRRIEIEVLTPGQALDAFAKAWRDVSGKAAEDMTPRLAFGSIKELFSAISEKRLELLRHVALHEGLNTRVLAAGLKRDYKNVHGDVAELVELGLLEKNAKGGLFAPFDEIVIHADVRKAA